MIGIILFLGTVEAAIQLFNSTTNTSLLSGIPLQNGVSLQPAGGDLGVEAHKLISIESTTSSNDGEASTSLALLAVVAPPHTPPPPVASALGSTAQSLIQTLITSAPLEVTTALQEGFSPTNVPEPLQPIITSSLQILPSVIGDLGDVPPKLPTLPSTTEISSKTTDIAVSEVASNYAPSHTPVITSSLQILPSVIGDLGDIPPKLPTLPPTTEISSKTTDITVSEVASNYAPSHMPVSSTDSPFSIAVSAIPDHGGSRITADTISEVTLGTQTLSAGHQVTVSGVTLSLDPSGSILVINHTRSHALAYTTQAYTKTASQGGTLTTITGTSIFLEPLPTPVAAYQTAKQEAEISQPNAGAQAAEPKLGDAILGLGGFTASATGESASLTTSYVPHEGGGRKGGSRNNTESVEYLGTGSRLEIAEALWFNVLLLSSVLTTLLYL